MYLAYLVCCANRKVLNCWIVLESQVPAKQQENDMQQQFFICCIGTKKSWSLDQSISQFYMENLDDLLIFGVDLGNRYEM
jgi:hypothetical protein